MSFDDGSAIGLDHDALPDGTMMVSPVAAAFTQSLTSVRCALAAVRVGLEPEQAAADVRVNPKTQKMTIASLNKPIMQDRRTPSRDHRFWPELIKNPSL